MRELLAKIHPWLITPGEPLETSQYPPHNACVLVSCIRGRISNKTSSMSLCRLCQPGNPKSRGSKSNRSGRAQDMVDYTSGAVYSGLGCCVCWKDIRIILGGIQISKTSDGSDNSLHERTEVSLDFPRMSTGSFASIRVDMAAKYLQPTEQSPVCIVRVIVVLAVPFDGVNSRSISDSTQTQHIGMFFGIGSAVL